MDNLNNYNFSQGTVVRNKKIVAIENKGGTEEMLKKCFNKKFKIKEYLLNYLKENKI